MMMQSKKTIKATTVAILVVLITLVGEASTPTFPGNWVYKGFYKIVNSLGAPLSTVNSITYITSGTYSGSWVGVANRGNQYQLMLFHMPDDSSGYVADSASVSSGCANSGSFTNNNLPPTVDNSSQKTGGCREGAVRTFGTFFCVPLVSQTKIPNGCVAPSNGWTGGYLGLETGGNTADAVESYGLWWDDTVNRLYLDFGDNYSCTTNRVLLSIDLSVATFATITGITVSGGGRAVVTTSSAVTPPQYVYITSDAKPALNGPYVLTPTDGTNQHFNLLSPTNGTGGTKNVTVTTAGTTGSFMVTPPAAYGPWVMSVAGTQLNCGEAQPHCRQATSRTVKSTHYF